MEDNSLYWWKVYVLIGATVIMLLVHLNKETTKDNRLNYAVSYVSKSNKLVVKEVKKEVKTLKDTVENNVVEKHSQNKDDKAKLLAEYLRKRRIGRGITNSRVIVSELNTDSISQHSTSDKTEIVQAETNVSKELANDKNSEFLSLNNLSAPSTADYKVSELEKNQKLITSRDVTMDQSLEYKIETNNLSGTNSISSLLNTYNKYQSVRNSTISYTVDGSLEFVDITSTDMISNQIPDNNINSPLISKPMGARNAEEDPLDGGGGVDNGGVYNDSGAGISGSLPISDGTNILIGFAILFIAIKYNKQNNKQAILTNDIV